MAGPVIFLVFPGFFMFFDDIGVVIFCGSGSGDPGLGSAVHGKTVHIEIFFRIGFQRSLFDKPLEIGFGFGIHRVGIEIDPFFQFDFRPGNPQKT